MYNKGSSHRNLTHAVYTSTCSNYPAEGTSSIQHSAQYQAEYEAAVMSNIWGHTLRFFLRSEPKMEDEVAAEQKSSAVCSQAEIPASDRSYRPRSGVWFSPALQRHKNTACPLTDDL